MLFGTIIALNRVGFTVTTASNTSPLSFAADGVRQLLFFIKLHSSAKIVELYITCCSTLWLSMKY